jgi:hypothetical protein
MEFFVTSICQPSTLAYECKSSTKRIVFQSFYICPVLAWIVNHSKSYTMAAASSWLEFWVEYLLFGRSKFYFRSTIYLGLLFVIMGQVKP